MVLTAMGYCHRAYSMADGPVVRRPVRFLFSCRRADGSFGEAADQDPITDFTPVENGSMCDRAICSNNCGCCVAHMDHRVILNVCARSDDNFMHFGAGHNVGPDGTALAQSDFAVDQGGVMDKRRVIEGDVWADVGHE